MLTKSELEEKLASMGTCRVERTKSTTDKDKFGEAVCAFANLRTRRMKRSSGCGSSWGCLRHWC